MKTVLIVAALLMSGCAKKRYQVCVYAGQDFKCMKHELSRPDAIGVGRAITQLGMDVVVKRKGVRLSAPDTPGAATPIDPREPPDDRTKI